MKMKELIGLEHDLGQVYYYDSIRVNLGLFQRDVNVIWDLAVHDLAIVQHVLGSSPVAVSANGVSHVRGAPENMAQLTVYLQSGVVAHLNVNWLAPLKVRQVLVGGSRKMIVWDDLEPSEKVKVYDRGVNVTDDIEQIYNMLVSYRIGDMWAPHLPDDRAPACGKQRTSSTASTGARPRSPAAAWGSRSSSSSRPPPCR